MLCQPDYVICLSCAWLPFPRPWSRKKIKKDMIGHAIDEEGQLERRSGGTLHTHDNDS